MNGHKLGEVCTHGLLARSCDMCEMIDRIKKIKALTVRMAIACVRFKDDPSDKRLTTLSNIIDEVREFTDEQA